MDMRRGLDIEKVEAAFKRAAHKAIHGTREERSGRVVLKGESRQPACSGTDPQVATMQQRAKDDPARCAARSAEDGPPRKA
jgi:hypothetical protein